METSLVTLYQNQLTQFNEMQDSIKIENVKFANTDGEEMTPVQTYLTPFAEVYIAFKLTNGSFLNVPANTIKKYIVGVTEPKYEFN